MNTEKINALEAIEILEKQITELKETLNNPIKPGQWYYIDDMLLFVKEFKHYGNYGIIGFGFDRSGRWCPPEEEGGFGVYAHKTNRPATPEEIEAGLREEWARRCKEAGWDDPDKAKLRIVARDNHPTYGGCRPYYEESRDILWNHYGPVYEQGKWAAPALKSSFKFFDWDAVIKDDHIFLHCPGHEGAGRNYQKVFLQDVEEALEHVQDKTVQEVLDELRKLNL